MEERIRKLFKKYVEGTATAKERQVIDDFFEKMQAKGIPAEKVRQDRLLKDRLDKKINKRKLAYKPLYVAAASLVILFSSILLVYLNQEETVTTVVARNGERLTITLPDSSLAYLNSGSSLTYSQTMGKKNQRILKLSGEAYFEVMHDPARPFVVESQSLRTRVLGTRFVVTDYPGETPSVVVRSGKVGVNTPSQQTATVLEMGQRVRYTNGATMVESVNAEDYYSWKDGKIIFTQADLQQVVHTLSRRFNVRIVVTSNTYKACTITGSYYDDRIEDVLKSLEFIYGIEYSFEKNGTIHIKAIPC